MKRDYLVYVFAFFAITLGVLILTQDFKKAPEAVPDCQHIIDSLHDEVFNAKVEAGRYESSLEYLQEVDPEAAKKFNQFFEHETE
jgi:hypothetical protein